jgi:hypothetical protein
MSDAKLDYLAAVHKKQEAVQLMLDGAALVQNGGTEGIKTVALEQPEIILSAISALVSVIKVQQEEFLALVEDRFELLDQLEKIRR